MSPLVFLLLIAGAAGAPITRQSDALQARHETAAAHAGLLAAAKAAPPSTDEEEDQADEEQMTRRATTDEEESGAGSKAVHLITASAPVKPTDDDADEKEDLASGDDDAEPPKAKVHSLHARGDNNTELWWWRKKSPPSAPPPSVPPPAAPPSELITLTNALLNGAIPHVEKYLDELIFKAVNQPNELVFDSLKATKSGGSAKLTAADIIKKMETTLVDLAMRDTAVDTSLPPTFASSTVGLNIDVATLITMAGSQQQTTGLPTVKVRHPKTRAYKTHARTCMRRHSRPNSSVMYVNVRAYAHYRQRRRGAHRLGDLLLLRVSRSRRVRTHHNSVVPYGP